MAITSNTISTAVGDLQVTIGDGSDTMDLINLSDISYKYDINDITADSITGVPFLIAGCSFTALDELGGGGSLEDTIADSINTNVDVDLGSYTFPLRYKATEYTVDDVKRTITMDLIASNDYAPGSNIPTFASAFDTDAGSNRDVAVFADVIESGLADFGETSYIVESSHFDVQSFPSSGDTDARWAAESGAVTEMTQAAAAEGAYYGIGFNNGFYVARGSTANKVTITQSDILSISRDISYPDLKDVQIDYDNASGTFQTGSFNETDTDTVNSSHRQSLTVTVDQGTPVRILYDGTDSRIESDTDANSATAALNVTSTGITAYEDVLRGSAPFTISVRVEGFDTIKPWQPFDITDTTGTLGNVTGKTFRPLELTYSINGYIDITAYQIA